VEEQLLKYSIAYYKSSGKSPVIEFICSRNEAGRAKIMFCMGLLREKGPELKRPYAAYLRDKIWELRPGVNTEEYRLFYFWNGKTAYFLHAVDKKNFRQRDIKLAEIRMKYMQKILQT
jgi:hypothetical protein